MLNLPQNATTACSRRRSALGALKRLSREQTAARSKPRSPVAAEGSEHRHLPPGMGRRRRVSARISRVWSGCTNSAWRQRIATALL